MSPKSTALPAPQASRAAAEAGTQMSAGSVGSHVTRSRLGASPARSAAGAVAAVVAVIVLLGGGEPALAALPPRVHTVDVGHVRVAYRTTGTGRPLLLVNGSGATLDTWDPTLVQALSQTRRVVVFDPRGMGGSTDIAGNRLTVAEMADDAAGLLRALKISRTDVLGWSLGGFVAQELAIRHPASVRRLVLASSSPGGRHATRASKQVTAIDEKTTIGLATPAEFLPILFPEAAQAAGRAWIERLAAQPGGCCEPYTQAAGRRQVAAGRRWFAASGGDERRLARINALTLIAAGTRDVVVPVKNARLLHQRIRRSRLLTYSDSGHAFLIQHAMRFGATVRHFLR